MNFWIVRICIWRKMRRCEELEGSKRNARVKGLWNCRATLKCHANSIPPWQAPASENLSSLLSFPRLRLARSSPENEKLLCWFLRRRRELLCADWSRIEPLGRKRGRCMIWGLIFETGFPLKWSFRAGKIIFMLDCSEKYCCDKQFRDWALRYSYFSCEYSSTARTQLIAERFQKICVKLMRKGIRRNFQMHQVKRILLRTFFSIIRQQLWVATKSSFKS